MVTLHSSNDSSAAMWAKTARRQCNHFGRRQRPVNFVPVGIFLRACTLSREGFLVYRVQSPPICCQQTIPYVHFLGSKKHLTVNAICMTQQTTTLLSLDYICLVIPSCIQLYDTLVLLLLHGDTNRLSFRIFCHFSSERHFYTFRWK